MKRRPKPLVPTENVAADADAGHPRDPDALGYAPPIHSTVPLETIHKARLQWLDATDDMLAESRTFLFEHGYGGVPHLRAYTSRTRDAERAKLGLPPLKNRTA